MPRVATSTTPLTANQTWDSGPLQPGLADTITGSVFADQAGTVFIEQSGDGINWDISTSYAVAASDGKGFSEDILLPNVRVRYTNGATNQGTFRIFVRMTSAGSR
jgi:hypothetical protein